MSTSPLLDALHTILGAVTGTVLLRESDLGEACVDHGDIDLLVSSAAVPAFLDTVDDVAASHGLHYRLRRSGPQKMGVQLLSADMAHSIELDLWERLWQIFGGRSYLTFEDVAAALETDDGPLPRLPAVLEASIYLQHLDVKGRDPALPANTARLASLAERCAADTELAGAIEEIVASGRLEPLAIALAEARLREHAGPDLEGRGARTRRRTVAQRAQRRRLERRTLGATALVGVDGCGKTSLGEQTAERLGYRTLLSKDAYRRSLVFRGIYKANRSTLKQPYEPIDNLLTPLTYAVAVRRLPKLIEGPTLLDRYLGDFLVVDRKSDRPRFSRLAGLLSRVHRPCQIVHIRASWATISSRKDEFSEMGHAWYDRSMAAYYRSLPVLDYVAFRNDGDLEPSVEALTRFLSDSRPEPRS